MQRAWLREFNALGLQLRPQAAKLITQFLQSCEDPQVMCEALVEHTKAYFRSKQGVVTSVIDEESIRNVINCMEKASAEAQGNNDPEAFENARNGVDTMDLGDGVQVYNVMTNMRPYTFYKSTKEWRPSVEGAQIFPDCKSKIKIYADRYHILWSRLLLKGEFVPEVEAIGSTLLPGQRVITPVESLVGNLGKKTTFGLISRDIQDDTGARRWIIEDMHQSYPLEFVESEIGSWSHQLVTDGCFVIAEGEMMGDRFCVHRIELPEAVPRQMSLERDQVPVQVFGGDLTDEQLNVLRVAEEENMEGVYVVLSEVHLDSVQVLERLSDIFQGYEETTPPAAYVFMGNFYSSPFVPTQEGVKNYQEGFERLKLVMRHIPNHVERGTRFIFIPGPNDPGAEMLPRTPLTNYLTSDIAKDIPSVIMGTNPCRVRHFSREIVFFRHDVLKLLRRHEVVPLRQPGQEGTPNQEHVRNEMVRILLDQGHLAPLPLQESNIMWDFDHTLRLYPLPDAVFVGGVSKPFEGEHQGCIFCSVGPFYRDGAFHAYSPIKEYVEVCGAPERAS
jgi:DNA polymerase epsilon subunit 2